MPEGETRLVQQLRTGPLRTVAAGVVAALLLGVLTGCTGGGEDPGEAASSPLPSRSVGAQPTLAAKPVPTRVTIARVVGGRLPKQNRGLVDRQVTRLVSEYFDEAYLGGEYPRKNFSRAFATFSPGAAKQARKDRDLVSNAGIGAETEAVVPRVKAARLDVLAPRHRVVGLTARVRLVFVQERKDGNDQRVTVKGRLLLQRKKTGRWQVFGYDLTRSSKAVTKGASR